MEIRGGGVDIARLVPGDRLQAKLRFPVQLAVDTAKPNLRNVVKVFDMADRLGLSLPGSRAAFAQSSGGSFILQALGAKVTAANAAHIADLNRTDLREFAEAMQRKGIDPTAILQWGSKAPDGLEELVRRLTADEVSV